MGGIVLCRKPYIAPGGAAYGCGQCMPCRINRRREWTHRLLLEQRCHSTSSFITLTYSDENIPLTPGEKQTLNKAHLRDFIKRLRWHHYPEHMRYFGVGEYGTETGRPHYHIAAFNFPPCSRGATSPNKHGDCCSVCTSLREIWGLGLVHSGQLEDDSAAYICGYVTKKLTSSTDPRLEGRAPEFATMSLKPGIGAGFIPEVASEILTHNLENQTDVPTSLRHGPNVKPLGRYLTRQLRKHTGKPLNAPQEVLDAKAEEMRPLREMAQKTAPRGTFRETYSELIRQENNGRYVRQVAKAKLYKKRESL